MTTTDKHTAGSRLFLVRIWKGDPSSRNPDARRSKVLDVLTGEARYFDGWADLVSAMEELSATGEEAVGALSTLPAVSQDPSVL